MALGGGRWVGRLGVGWRVKDDVKLERPPALSAGKVLEWVTLTPLPTPNAAVHRPHLEDELLELPHRHATHHPLTHPHPPRPPRLPRRLGQPPHQLPHGDVVLRR